MKELPWICGLKEPFLPLSEFSVSVKTEKHWYKLSVEKKFKSASQGLLLSPVESKAMLA